MRQWVLIRDHHTCQLRLPGCTTKATQVHHLRGKKYGDDPALLVASCQSCNLKIGDPEKHGDPKNRPVTRW